MALRLGTLGLGAAPRSNHTHLCECWCSLKKEVKSYYKEATKQEAKIAKMRESGADSHDINKQVRRWSQVTAFLNSTSRACVCVCVCVCVWLRVAVCVAVPVFATGCPAFVWIRHVCTRLSIMQLEVLAETENMIPDTKARFQRALDDLEEFVVRGGRRAS